MPLLGWPLLALLGALAVGVPVATFWLWPRLRGPRPLRALVRLGMLAGCQVAAVLLVAAALNNYGYFYGSWSDLVGNSQQQGSVAAPRKAVPASNGRTGAAPQSGATVDPSAVRTLADPGWSSPAQWPTRGRVESVTITGTRSQLRSHAFVYLPPQYFQRAFAHETFSAALVLTGFPGDDLNLVNRLRYPDHLLALIDAHRAKPMVLVMMRPSVTSPRDTECTDVPAGPQALTFFAQDVPAAVSGKFRVQPAGWGAVGDSTGGYCATKLAMMQSNVYSAAVSLSGYFHTLQDSTTGDLWAGSSVVRNLNDPGWRLQHLPPPPVSLLVVTARDEHGSDGYAENSRFLTMAHAVGAPFRVDSLILAHGGHNFTTWDAALPESLSWLSAKLSLAVPHRW